MENSDQISEETVDVPLPKKLRSVQRVGPEVCQNTKGYYLICPFGGLEWEEGVYYFRASQLILNITFSSIAEAAVMFGYCKRQRLYQLQ